MENKEKEILVQDIMKAGSEAFTEQLMKMTKDKVIAPYSLIEYHRLVLDLYKKSLSGDKPSEDKLTGIQSKLNFAIDRAKINDLPFDELEALKKDVNRLKYEVR